MSEHDELAARVRAAGARTPLNDYPMLSDRHVAAAEWLGTSDSKPENIRLRNAFAAGALWQHRRLRSEQVVDAEIVEEDEPSIPTVDSAAGWTYNPTSDEWPYRPIHWQQ